MSRDTLSELDKTLLIVSTALALLKVRSHKRSSTDTRAHHAEDDIPCLEHLRALELLDPSTLVRSSPKFLINGLFWMKSSSEKDINSAIYQLINLPSTVHEELWRELETLLHRKVNQKLGHYVDESDLFSPLLYIFKYTSDVEVIVLVPFRKAMLHTIFDVLESVIRDCRCLTDRVAKENKVYRVMGLLTILHECLVLFGETLKRAEGSGRQGGFGGLLLACRSWLLSRHAHLLVESSLLPTIPAMIQCMAEDVEAIYTET